jgi:hypothetical protein
MSVCVQVYICVFVHLCVRVKGKEKNPIGVDLNARVQKDLILRNANDSTAHF